jgi:hypothetical protein
MIISYLYKYKKMGGCEICKNMLVKYCKHCEFEKVETDAKTAAKTAIEISRTIYSEGDVLYNQHVNKYQRFDPTLISIEYLYKK